MNKFFLIALMLTAITSAALTSCSGNKRQADVVTVDLLKAIEEAPVNRLEVYDVTYTPLDTTSLALLAPYTSIKGIKGDTIVIVNYTALSKYRVSLFSLTDGRMTGNLDHEGNGPGEYRWIESVFVDPSANELIIKTPDRKAYRYSFADSLLETYTLPWISGRRLATGTLSTTINSHHETEYGDVIYQFDAGFNLVDSILLPGYNLVYHAGLFDQSGEMALVSMVDTIYEILPGKLEKRIIMNRGGKTITPEIEKNLEKISDYNQRQAEVNKYVCLYGVTITDDFIIMNPSYREETYTTIFDRKNGELLYSEPMSVEAYGMPIEWNGVIFHTYNFFYYDGTFYCVIDEDEAVDAEGNPNNGDLNSGLLTFKLRTISDR